MRALLAFLFALYAVLSPAAVSAAARSGGEGAVIQQSAKHDDCACCDSGAGAAISCAVQCHAALAPAAFAATLNASSRKEAMRATWPLYGLSLKPPAPPPRLSAG
jgi:hypothetical protein